MKKHTHTVRTADGYEYDETIAFRSAAMGWESHSTVTAERLNGKPMPDSDVPRESRFVVYCLQGGTPRMMDSGNPRNDFPTVDAPRCDTGAEFRAFIVERFGS